MSASARMRRQRSSAVNCSALCVRARKKPLNRRNLLIGDERDPDDLALHCLDRTAQVAVDREGHDAVDFFVSAIVSTTTFVARRGVAPARRYQLRLPRSIKPCSGKSSLAASSRVTSRLTRAAGATCQRVPARHDRAPSPASPSPA